jgi:Domain of unknown function (DUF397)
MTGAEWRKSSYSSNNGNCVEAALLPDMVAVRDSKDPNGTALTFSPQSWTALTKAIKDGEFS